MEYESFKDEIDFGHSFKQKDFDGFLDKIYHATKISNVVEENDNMDDSGYDTEIIEKIFFEGLKKYINEDFYSRHRKAILEEKLENLKFYEVFFRVISISDKKLTEDSRRMKKEMETIFNIVFWDFFIYYHEADFEEIEETINKIPGPLKLKLKLRTKGILKNEFSRIMKNARSGAVALGVTISSLEKLYDSIPIIYREEGLKSRILTDENIEQKITKKIFGTPENVNQELSIERKMELQLGKIKQRLENINSEDKTKILNNKEKFVEEINKILFNLENFSEEIEKNDDFQEKKEKFLEKINELKLKSEEVMKNILDFKEKTISILEEKNFEKNDLTEKKIEKIDNYTGTKYEEFIKYLLSDKGFHYNLSNTNNPEVNDSQGDGSFSTKIARPIFYWLEDNFYKGNLNPENISWNEIYNLYFTQVDEKRIEIKNFFELLNKFSEKGDFFKIFSDFKEAVSDFSKTNYYNKSTNKESLRGISMFLDDVENKFEIKK